MIEKNIRLEPHHSRDLLVGRRSDNRRPKYQPPGHRDAPSRSTREGPPGQSGRSDPSPSRNEPPSERTYEPSRVSEPTRTVTYSAPKEDKPAVQYITKKDPVATTVDYSSLDNEEQLAVDLGLPTAQMTPKERNEQGYGTGGTRNPDYLQKQFEETGDLDVFTDLTGFDDSPKIDISDIHGEWDDPDSVSFAGTDTYGKILYDPKDQAQRTVKAIEEAEKQGGIMKKVIDFGKEVALNMFLPKPIRTALGYYKGAKKVSNFLAKKGVTKNDIVELGLAKLKNLKGGELIDDKIDTQKKYTKKLVKAPDGDERRDDIVKQVSGGEDVVTKTAKKFTGITDEQRTELIKRRNMVQGILDQGSYKGREITGEQRNNLINYIQQISKFLVDPIEMAAHGGRIGKALEGRNRYI